MVEQSTQPPVLIFPSSTHDSQPESLSSADAALDDADSAAIQQVIEEQMAAFQADDAEVAFRFASPDVQKQFQDADRFMAMVQSSYAPVYRAQSVNFEALRIIRGQPIQAVTLMGPSGEWVTAYYQMEQQQDETWRIAGCVLVPLPGETI